MTEVVLDPGLGPIGPKGDPGESGLLQTVLGSFLDPILVASEIEIPAGFDIVIVFVAGDGGPASNIEFTGTPKDLCLVELIGTSNTDTVEVDTTDQILLRGSNVLKAYSSQKVRYYDETLVYAEDSRNEL